MTIIPHPEFLFEKGDTVNLWKNSLFKGSENIISYQKQVSVKWICHYNMRLYPFDTQKCTMEMYPSEDLITLNPTFVKYSGPINLPQHYVKGVNICPTIFDDKQGIIVEVFLGRPIFGAILSVFMPTSILLLLCQMVRVFSLDYLDMVIEVNLTLLLVLATL